MNPRPPPGSRRARPKHSPAEGRHNECRPLAYYVSHAEPRNYQPTNVTFGIIAPLQPLPGRKVPRKKAERNIALSGRALADLDAWMKTHPRDRAAAAARDGRPEMRIPQ